MLEKISANNNSLNNFENTGNIQGVNKSANEKKYLESETILKNNSAQLHTPIQMRQLKRFHSSKTSVLINNTLPIPKINLIKSEPLPLYKPISLTKHNLRSSPQPPATRPLDSTQNTHNNERSAMVSPIRTSPLISVSFVGQRSAIKTLPSEYVYKAALLRRQKLTKRAQSKKLKQHGTSISKTAHVFTIVKKIKKTNIKDIKPPLIQSLDPIKKQSQIMLKKKKSFIRQNKNNTYSGQLQNLSRHQSMKVVNREIKNQVVPFSKNNKQVKHQTVVNADLNSNFSKHINLNNEILRVSHINITVLKSFDNMETISKNLTNRNSINLNSKAVPHSLKQISNMSLLSTTKETQINKQDTNVDQIVASSKTTNMLNKKIKTINESMDFNNKKVNNLLNILDDFHSVGIFKKKVYGNDLTSLFFKQQHQAHPLPTNYNLRCLRVFEARPNLTDLINKHSKMSINLKEKISNGQLNLFGSQILQSTTPQTISSQTIEQDLSSTSANVLFSKLHFVNNKKKKTDQQFMVLPTIENHQAHDTKLKTEKLKFEALENANTLLNSNLFVKDPIAKSFSNQNGKNFVNNSSPKVLVDDSTKNNHNQNEFLIDNNNTFENFKLNKFERSTISNVRKWIDNEVINNVTPATKFNNIIDLSSYNFSTKVATHKQNLTPKSLMTDFKTFKKDSLNTNIFISNDIRRRPKNNFLNATNNQILLTTKSSLFVAENLFTKSSKQVLITLPPDYRTNIQGEPVESLPPNKFSILPLRKKNIETTEIPNTIKYSNLDQETQTVKTNIFPTQIGLLNQDNINAINTVLARKQSRRILASLTDKNANRIIGYRNKILHAQNQLNKVTTSTPLHFDFMKAERKVKLFRI